MTQLSDDQPEALQGFSMDGSTRVEGPTSLIGKLSLKQNTVIKNSTVSIPDATLVRCSFEDSTLINRSKDHVPCSNLTLLHSHIDAPSLERRLRLISQLCAAGNP